MAGLFCFGYNKKMYKIISLIVAKLENLTHHNPPADNTSVNAAIERAWIESPYILPGPDFSDVIPSIDGVHFKTENELKLAGERWGDAILRAFPD